jgi:hypothetical protein
MQFEMFGWKIQIWREPKSIYYPEKINDCLTELVCNITPTETPFLTSLLKSHKWESGKIKRKKHKTKRRVR